MQCTPRLMPLCSIPPLLGKEGQSGPNAQVYIPFYGFYRFDGQTYTFPYSTVPQDSTRFVTGNYKTPNYRKDCCGA